MSASLWSRSALLRQIKEAIEPRLWDSSYRVATSPDGNILKGSRPLRLHAFRSTRGEWVSRRLRGGFVVQEFDGFTEEGVMTGTVGEGHGLVTICWAGIPVEDLRKLLRIAKTMPSRSERPPKPLKPWDHTQGSDAWPVGQSGALDRASWVSYMQKRRRNQR